MGIKVEVEYVDVGDDEDLDQEEISFLVEIVGFDRQKAEWIICGPAKDLRSRRQALLEKMNVMIEGIGRTLSKKLVNETVFEASVDVLRELLERLESIE